MKRISLLQTILLAAVSMIFFACAGDTEKTTDNNKDSIVAKDSSTTIDSSKTLKEIADTSVRYVSSQILAALKKQDYQSFVSYFDPKGVRFSPYGYIDMKTSRTISANDFLSKLKARDSLFWGYYDGSGDSIRLNVQQYIDRFIYNADFANAEKSSVNKIIGQGNSLNNIHKIYPTGIFTEYHFSGFDLKYQKMDWTSLRLVFQKKNNRYYLVAVVHDQWTS